MKTAERRNTLKKFGVAVWAMVTLILLFCVLLLVREMLDRGDDPFKSLRNMPQANAPAAAPSTAPAGSKRDIPLFFATADGGALSPESHSLTMGDSTVENCRQALQALIAGPRDILSPVFPSSVKVRALYLLDDGELVVDFSGEIMSEQMRFKSASLESLMAYAVVNTLTQSELQAKQDPPVRRIRFLFEGAPPQEAFPAHIDLSEPLAPDTRWLETPADTPSNG